MKKIFNSNIIIGLGMTIMTTSCVQKQEQTNDKGEVFDITKYLEQMEDNPELRYGIGDFQLKEYALLDIDGDSQDEVWVRDTTRNYLAIYVVDGDSVQLVAYADGATELNFYKDAVGFTAYYTPGRSWNGAQKLKNSKLTDYFISEVQWDSFSDEQEVTYEWYNINGKSTTSEECDKFVKQLGEPVDEPVLEWLPISLE